MLNLNRKVATMAYQDTLHPAEVFSQEMTATRNFLTRAGHAIGKVFAAIGSALVKGSVAQSRMNRVNALTAKTDEELAALGLRRQDIVHHVFRDIHYI